MQQLSPDGKRRIEDLAQRYDTSPEAATTLLRALVAGGGTMAQFNHPDLGGMGQWSQGGMIMVGDMFNNALKGKVDGLCRVLADMLIDQSDWQQTTIAQPAGTAHETSFFIPKDSANAGNWWGADLGAASSTGAQNATRYAYFPGSRRLAIQSDGKVALYDTGEHEIGGVSQQQSGDTSLTFTSQRGLVRVSDLNLVSDIGEQPKEQPAKAETAEPGPGVEPAQSSEIIALIEMLAALHEKDILSDEEFTAKKAELLARL